MTGDRSDGLRSNCFIPADEDPILGQRVKVQNLREGIETIEAARYFKPSMKGWGLSEVENDKYVNSVGQQTELLQENKALAPCAKSDVEKSVENEDPDCGVAGRGGRNNANKKDSNISLPEQTVSALGENLPWDPEGDANSCNDTNYLGDNLHIIYGVEIPLIKERLVADVKLRKDARNETYSHGYDKMSHCVEGYSAGIRFDTLSPDVDGLSGGVGESWIDRRKRSTMRRINWETNFIPPVDFIESKTSLQHHLQVPLRRSQQIGKETSV